MAWFLRKTIIAYVLTEKMNGKWFHGALKRSGTIQYFRGIHKSSWSKV